MSRGIHRISASYIGSIDPTHDPIWMKVQTSPRHAGMVYCMRRELAITIRDCLNDALAEAPDDSPAQMAPETEATDTLPLLAAAGLEIL